MHYGDTNPDNPIEIVSGDESDVAGGDVPEDNNLEVEVEVSDDGDECVEIFTTCCATRQALFFKVYMFTPFSVPIL